jgi:acyl-CoA thioesterase
MPDKSTLRRKVSPFAHLVGLRSDIDKGTLRCSLDIEGKHLNVNGTVHGGVISTLADVSMGWEVFEHLSDKESITTIEMSVNYFAAVSSGTLVAEATLLHRSRKLAVLESRITCGDRLVAKATGTFYVLPASHLAHDGAGD